MQLTPEQLDKAARITYEMWYDGYQSWGECPKRHKEDMRKAITAAFAAVEPRQVDVPRDLVERMICAFCSYDAYEHLTYNAELLRKMAAALRVALEDPRVLGNVASGEPFTALHEGVINSFLASRRARLLQPKTPEERVTIEQNSSTGSVLFFIDGKQAGECFKEYAEQVRLGLIAKLKAEGTISHEAGGNAQ